MEAIMKKNTILLALLSTVVLPTFAAENKDSIQAELMSTQFYEESCYIEPTEQNSNLDLTKCENYIFINLSNLKDQDRSAITAQLFGIGVMSPYVLVNNPKKESERIITSLDSFEKEIIIDLINDSDSYWESNQTQLSTADLLPRAEASTSIGHVLPRAEPLTSRAGSTSSDSPSDYSWRFRYLKKLNQGFYPTKNDIAILYYEVSAIASSPAYGNRNNSKYIRVTLVGGAGINFNPTEGWSTYKTISTNSPSHQLGKYSYREYLDKVKISTSWNDNKVELYDSFPRNNDQDRTGVTYNSKIAFELGISIPKVPIKKVAFESSKSLTFTNGNYFDYYANSALNKHSVEYKNKEYGSDNNKYYGLVNNSRDRWDYLDGIEPPFKTFDNLRNTPYSNGFIPEYSATYLAGKGTTGKSILTITTDVRGMSLQGFSKWWIGRLYWGGVNSRKGYGDDYISSSYADSLRVSVNWDSPIFSGVEPSVITYPYLSDETQHCFTVNPSHDVTAQPCDKSNIDQLFIYTPERKYVYANDRTLCLDSSQKQLKVKTCSTYGSNNQDWMWYTAPLSSNVNDNTLLYTTKSSGDFKVLKGGDVNETVSVEDVDALDEAFKIWPRAKLNTQKGKYTSTIKGLK